MSMSHATKVASILVLAAVLAGCTSASSAGSSAASRNVGEGSSVGGQPTSDMGSASGGNDIVPGAPSTKGLNGGGQ